LVDDLVIKLFGQVFHKHLYEKNDKLKLSYTQIKNKKLKEVNEFFTKLVYI